MDSVPVAAPRTKRSPTGRAFRFSEAQRQAIVEAYESGATMASLAERYDVRRVSISKLLHRSGVEIRQRRAMSQTEIDQALQLYASGLSLQRIGDRLRWDHNTVYRQLKKRDVMFRGPSDWKY